MRYVKMKVKYAFLLKNWQALLVKEIEQERGMLERDKVIVALQARLKAYETLPM